MELPRETAARNRREAQKEKDLSQSGCCAARPYLIQWWVQDLNLKGTHEVEAAPDVIGTEGLSFFPLKNFE
jgi:hypothetical protein